MQAQKSLMNGKLLQYNIMNNQKLHQYGWEKDFKNEKYNTDFH